jgi:hypothetical protein
MAQSLVKRLSGKIKGLRDRDEDHTKAYRWLAANRHIRDCCIGDASEESNFPDSREIEWRRVYDTLFADHYTTPDDVREIFSNFVDEANGVINWAHLCLGELVRQRLVSTIITTNFDQLVLSGLVRSGVLPVVCDGIESLTRIRGAPQHPQVIELHGSRHTYRLRNSPEEVAALANDESTIGSIASIFQDLRAFIVVGYGGREAGIMELLIKAGQRFADKRLIWIQRSKDPSRISDKAKQFLATSRNSYLLVDQDADSFFLRLLQALEIGAPKATREPLFLANYYAATLATYSSEEITARSDIGAELDRYQREVTTLNTLLDDFRTRTDKSDKNRSAITKARELRLAGKHSDALQVLKSVPEHLRSQEAWEAIGEAAFEHGKTTGDVGILELAATARRKALEWAERTV